MAVTEVSHDVVDDDLVIGGFDSICCTHFAAGAADIDGACTSSEDDASVAACIAAD